MEVANKASGVPLVGGSVSQAEQMSGAVDTHVHIFDPARFPYAVPRQYTPDAASIGALQAHLASIGFQRAVIVQPSVYGTDNRCLLDAIARLGASTARGIAVIDPSTITSAEVCSLADAGVVGVRVNIHTSGNVGAEAVADAVAATMRRVAVAGLVVQLFVDLSLVDALEATIAASPVPVVLDHYAGTKSDLGAQQPGFAALLRLLDAGRVWIKLSALYRAGKNAPEFDDVAAIAKLLIASNPERLVWGSDWPHTGGGKERAARQWNEIEPFREIDNRNAVALTSAWAGTRDLQNRIFVTNPATLFRF